MTRSHRPSTQSSLGSSAPPPRIRSARAAVATAAFVIVTLVGAPASLGQAQRGDRDCDLSSTGATPLTDLATGDYQGAQGGLYPEGSNETPPAHLATGLRRAREITPLDASGNPDPDGKIALASIGMSNTYREFGEFQRSMESLSDRNPALVLANAAQGGQDLTEWMGGKTRPWDGLDDALDEAGVTREQVQAVWVKLTDRPAAGTPFPDNALSFRDRMTVLLGQLQDRLPNLQVAYLSSRVYGGYNATSSPSPEPLAYDEGFGVKWVIERQMYGDPALAADADGAPEAPWAAWGPYLWADGTSPRGDGLTWDCRNFRGDGVHPEKTGNEKVADLLVDFFRSEPTANWMWRDGAVPEPPSDPAALPPPSTIAGDDGSTAPPDTEAPTTRPPRNSPPPTSDPSDTSTADPSTTTGSPTDPSSTDAGGSDTAEGPATTQPPEAGAGGGDTGGSGPSPVAWMLLGAGLALAVASGVAWLRTRRP